MKGDGSRTRIEAKKFSIVAPIGWDIIETFRGLSLLLREPKQKSKKYQATIQAMVLKGSKYINEETAIEFQEKIRKRFGSANTAISKYSIRNYETVSINDGRAALLFYSDFYFGEHQMMQAHILVSSAKTHVLMTYTDLASSFTNDSGISNLDIAWKSMVSLELDSSAPMQINLVFYLAGFLLLIVGLMALFFVKRRSNIPYDDLEIDQDTEETKWNIS